ncbi:MAG: hypothetical protein WBZ37_24210 [Mycobacterium sp.]
MAPGRETDGKGRVQWSNPVWAALREPDPMSQPRAAQTPSNRLAADLFFGDPLANLHLHLKHKVDLERVAEIRDLRSSEF